MSADTIGFSFVILGVFLLIGKLLRVNLAFLRNLYLPSSIIAGFLALIVGPEVLGRLTQTILSSDSIFYEGLVPQSALSVWETLPGLFINIIFASLFLGKVIPKVKEIWDIAGPQVIMGQTVSWGLYVFGLLMTIFVLVPFYDMSPLTGALLEISFVGGHGTAAGLSATFTELNFEEGLDLAIGLATIGIVVGVLIGILLINWGAKKGYARFVSNEEEITEKEKRMMGEFDEREQTHEIEHSKSLEPLAFHFAIVGGAIGLGYILLELLILLEEVTWGAWLGVYLVAYVPLFPLAMLGGMIIQIVFNRFKIDKFIDRELINRINGFALDILIMSALATLSLAVIGDNIIPFLLLAIIGILWVTFSFVILAPRLIPTFWFERGVGDFGQAMGMAATGLLLMNIADPNNKSPALEGFGYKQILFEPFVGGGLFTAGAMPLIYQFGAMNFLIFSTVITISLLVFGSIYFKKKSKPSR